MVREIGKSPGIALVNSLNPYRLEGQKTIAFEVIEQLGKVPDLFALPVGNAGNISAAWKGFTEYAERTGEKRPELLGVQAEGASPIVQNKVVEQPETIATAIRIGNPASWQLALNALDESQGTILSRSDDKILEAYQLLAKTEGVFAEPASCASIAGLKKQVEDGQIKKGSTVVCVLTGNGLKDPATAIEVSKQDGMLEAANMEQFWEELKKEVKV